MLEEEPSDPQGQSAKAQRAEKAQSWPAKEAKDKGVSTQPAPAGEPKKAIDGKKEADGTKTASSIFRRGMGPGTGGWQLAERCSVGEMRHSPSVDLAFPVALGAPPFPHLCSNDAGRGSVG